MTATARPTLTLVGVDRDLTYFYWQWVAPTSGGKSTFVVDRAELDTVVARLTDAVPVARRGESQKDMLARVLTSGALADPAAELSLSTDLAALLLPPELAQQIADAYRDGGEQPILIRLMPSAATASVPWELFPIAIEGRDDRRLIDVADLVREVPAGIHAGRARVPSGWQRDQPTLYIVDPATRAHLPVLEEEGHEPFRRRLTERGHEASRVDDEFTRRDLSVALTGSRPPARLFYVGHVIQSLDDAGSTSFLLSDPHDTFGVSPVYNDVNRPLSALDLFEGTQNWERRVQTIEERDSVQRRLLKWPINRETRRAGARIWPMPPRVALIACNSGSDLAHSEPFGLAIALINAGAEIVTATKWTLPTDHAYRDLLDSSARPLVETALALDEAHAAPDPVGVIADWQRARLDAWRSGESDPSAAPLLWAAFSTYVASERAVDASVPVTEAIRLVAG